MVQFGKTLDEAVESNWRCHAVAYTELKRALGASTGTATANAPSCNISNDNRADGPHHGANNGQCGTNEANSCTYPAMIDDDVHSVHTDSPYCISDTQKANFFRVYEDSIRRVANFYESKVKWASEERNTLEQAVGKRMGEDEVVKAKNDRLGTSPLIRQINNFSRDLGLALEFLELNATAFSKIMKKFDKRTGSNLREAKLKELEAGHPYLYDGGELTKCKVLCSVWIKELQQDSKMPAERLKGRFVTNSRSRRSSSSLSGNCVGLNLANSLITVDRDKVSKAVQSKKAIDANGGKNPQESSETKKKDPILLTMIDRVNEELCLQKADSPFFDNALEQTPPPSFRSSEVDLARALGEGEFCKIYEVSQFNIPESCRICSLHRGLNDVDPSLEFVLKASNYKASHGKIPNTAIADNPHVVCRDCQDKETKPAAANNEGLSAQTITHAAAASSQPPIDISDQDDDDYEQITRGFMKDHCLRNGEARYAIKRIRSDIVGQEEITDAAVDLAREAEFLAALKHPNIIRIRGTINVPGHPKYSLVLDRLFDTLTVQMKKWKLDKKRYQGTLKGLIGRDKIMLSKLWMDRLLASYDLARAMAYLHDRGIIHRDIKPDNIGFDVRGDIKIFDFGLAKELKPSEREGEDKYHTDGLAGTRRYMAPEVAQVMPYGLSSDVYSFGIVMWEMLSLKHAYEKLTREKHYKDVVVEGKRPKVSKSWPFVIQNLLNICWHKDPLERPTFHSVCELIKFGSPDYCVDASGRSDSLMLRSYRSNACRGT